MPDFSFCVEAIEPVRHAVSPHLAFRVAVAQEGPKALRIRNILLHAQIRLEPRMKETDARSQERLRELFGADEPGGRGARGLLWTHVDTVVLPFVGRTTVELAVPCSYDFNVAVARYLDTLEEGSVPLRLLFSGTVFHEEPNGALQVSLIPWERDAPSALRVQVWRDLMEQHYPRSGWLRLGKEVIDRLRLYQRRSRVPTWERAFERLLDSAEFGGPP